eukprot:3005814-Amphidinium_carterae.2
MEPRVTLNAWSVTCLLQVTRLRGAHRDGAAAGLWQCLYLFFLRHQDGGIQFSSEFLPFVLLVRCLVAFVLFSLPAMFPGGGPPPGARQLNCVLIVIACDCDMAWGDVGSTKLVGELLSSMLIAGKPSNWQQRNKPQKKETNKPKRGEFGDGWHCSSCGFYNFGGRT